MALLSCQDLSLGYEGKTFVTGLTFEVNAGDYLCIVGENGSGKSTLMKTILNLKAPLAGKILMGDGLQPYDIGYMPQQTQTQKDFPASVREIVRSGCLNRSGFRPYFTRTEKIMADENMEKLGLAHLSSRCYRELSGGQQQRVLLARALCAARKAILLDEPTAGLDPLAAADFYALIKQINQEGLTILMISHDITAAVNFASHILHMGSQKNIFFGPAAAYMNSDAGKIYTRQYGEPA